MSAANRRTLDKARMRVTSQRSLIINIIRQGHFDADEIFRRAKEKEPRLSLSTVYRTLQRLKKLGLVEELHFDEGHHHYEAKPSVEHYHLVCLRCGKVIELRQTRSDFIKKSVAEAEDFEIVGTEVRVTGYCAKCRKK